MFEKYLKARNTNANSGATTIKKDITSAISQNRRQLHEQPDSWFATSTRLGQVLLGQYRQDNTGDLSRSTGMIQDVLSLQNKEPAIQLIENWLGLALDFVPTFSTPGNLYFQIEITTKVNTPTRFLLALPVSTMSAIGQPDEALLNTCRMQWKPLPLRLRLSCVDVAQPKIDKLEAGGLYLLAESFQPDWFCDTYILDKTDLNYRAKINQGSKLNILYSSLENKMAAAHSRQAPQQSNEVMVYLKASVSVPVNHLMQWSDHPGINLENILFNSPAFLLYRNKKIATGKIITASNGYAVLIDKRY